MTQAHPHHPLPLLGLQPPVPHRLVLASQSPRRRELLGRLLEGFNVDHGTAMALEVLGPSSHDEAQALEALEAALPGEHPQAYVERVAQAKAHAGWARLFDEGPCRAALPQGLWLLASDTTVSVDDEILGKPIDAADFRRMMQKLSGRSHAVRTAVCLVLGEGQVVTAVSVNTVNMAALPTAWIDRLAASTEPYDKAGGYAIQGEAGAYIESIEGSPSGIVGLPLHETRTLLLQGLALANVATPHIPTLRPPLP